MIQRRRVIFPPYIKDSETGGNEQDIWHGQLEKLLKLAGPRSESGCNLSTDPTSLGRNSRAPVLSEAIWHN
jgi:hypothetical protein